MSTQGGFSERGPDTFSDGDEEDEKVDKEVEEEDEEEEEDYEEEEEEEGEEDEEADDGEEEGADGEEIEEIAGGTGSEDKNEDAEEEDEKGEGKGEGGEDGDSPQGSLTPVDEKADDDTVHKIKSEGEGASLVAEASAEFVSLKDKHEIVGDQQCPTPEGSVDADKCGSLQVKEKTLAEVTHKRNRNDSCIVHPEDLVLDIGRHQSPGAVVLENGNKRPAMACAFFARGWCVKGNSCRFLHQKDGDDTNQVAEEDRNETSVQKDPKEENSSTESLQRALVRAYGGHGSHQFQDVDTKPVFQRDPPLIRAGNVGVQLSTSKSNSVLDRYKAAFTEGTSIPCERPLFPLSEYAQTAEAEDVKSYGASDSGEKWSSHLKSVDGGWPMSRGQYLSELSRTDCKEDGKFPEGSSLVKDSFVTQYQHCSSPSLVPSNPYLGSSSTHVSDGHAAESVEYQCLSSFRVPATPYFTKDLVPRGISLNTSHSTRGSLPPSMEYLDANKEGDYERGYQASRSTSPFSQFGPEKSGQHVSAGSTSIFADKTVQSSRYAWEPSVPFRSSFYCPEANLPSPGSQYDPLSDSLEPQSLPNQHKNIDHASNINLQTSFPKSHQSILNKSNPEYGTGDYPSYSTGVSVLGTFDGINKISMLKDKSFSPGRFTDSGNLKDMNCQGTTKNQEDKARHHKESKALKNFRASLVEFIKEMLKPAWREGHLSKDAHKTVVKKAAEKVLSALQANQVPSTVDAVNQYLSASRPKIIKLVEGYVEKYSKS